MLGGGAADKSSLKLLERCSEQLGVTSPLFPLTLEKCGELFCGLGLTPPPSFHANNSSSNSNSNSSSNSNSNSNSSNSSSSGVSDEIIQLELAALQFPLLLIQRDLTIAAANVMQKVKGRMTGSRKLFVLYLYLPTSCVYF
jgi:hypothetical protein